MRVRRGGLLLLLSLLWSICSPVGAQGATIILADPADPYYALAREMAQVEGLLIVHGLDEALAAQPAFLLWVVSPDRLSDRAMIDLGLALRDRPSAIATGIITGATLDDARALWQRAAAARGERVYAINAANPSGNVEAGISEVTGADVWQQPLNKANLIQSLQQADYVTFTGHGSSTYLRLDDETTLRAADVPALPPLVVATGSCNTFRPWEPDSIALAFVQQGVAAYAGFVYSPNEGYLMGEFDGLPFRYTWPGFPIGQVVQVLNRGTLQGFASLPYYHLLGDPRLAFQAEAPYRLVGVQAEDGSLVQHYAGAPRGLIPVRVPGGARYAAVEVPGVGLAWRGEPFYNARLQMVDVGEDKLVLLAHEGGDFTLRLRSHTPWLRAAADVILDALDGTLLFLQDNGGALLMLGAGGLALAVAVLLLVRRKAPPRLLLPAAAIGLTLAVFHGLYALARLEQMSVTSKAVDFSLLAPVSTFLLGACGAFFFLCATSWRGRAMALVLTTLGALAPAAFLLLLFGVADDVIVGRELGVGLWNCRLGLQPLVVSVLGIAVLRPVFHVMRKHLKGWSRDSDAALQPTSMLDDARNPMKEDAAHV